MVNHTHVELVEHEKMLEHVVEGLKNALGVEASVEWPYNIVVYDLDGAHWFGTANGVWESTFYDLNNVVVADRARSSDLSGDCKSPHLVFWAIREMILGKGVSRD
jgi:hypothetical protein